MSNTEIRGRKIGRAFTIFADLPFMLLLLGQCFLVAGVAVADDEMICGTTQSLTLEQIAPFDIDKHDTLRALWVFADFSDGENGTPCDSTWWPAGATFPAWKDSLLEDTLTPSIDMSITRYFDVMSDGQHIVLGDVYGSVVRAESTIAYYDSVYTGSAWDNAAGYIVTQVINSLGSDALDYDYDGDGYFDYMFIYFKQFKSTLGNYYINNGGNYGGESILYAGTEKVFVVSGDSLRVSRNGGCLLTAHRFPQGGGAYKYSRSLRGALRFADHEYVHTLQFTTGISMPLHTTSMGPYSLMNDSGQGVLVEAFLRHTLDWFDPPLTPITADTTLVLGDVVRDGRGGAAILATADSLQFFVLEVRDTTASNCLKTGSPAGCGWPPQFSGLLVTHTQKFGLNNWGWKGGGYPEGFGPPFEDPEVATGMFDADGIPDPALGEDAIESHGVSWWYAQPKDLFRDDIETSNTLAPYTNPNTNLYKVWDHQQYQYRPAEQSRFSGMHIYNVQWKNAARDSMVVSVRFEGTTVPSSGDTLSVNTTWDGSLQVMGDVVVKSGKTLTVKEGTRVVCAADQDMFTAGKDTTKVEILCRGQLTIDGTESLPALLTTSRNEDFLHWCVDDSCYGEENTAPSAGDWYGLRFDVAGCNCNGYGFSAGSGPLSRLEGATVEYSDFGVKIENFQAPAMIDVSFSEITDSLHIYLDSTDVFTPAGTFTDGPEYCDEPFEAGGGEWKLLGGTHVVAANGTRASQDMSCLGVEDKVDLVLYGKTITTGSASEPVVFRPETTTDVDEETSAQDWGGIFMAYESSGSNLRFADIGYAANPLYVYYPDSTSIANSTIHHFAETGLWVHGSIGDGIAIDSVTVERGEGLNVALAETGVYLDQSDQASLENSLISLEGRDNSETGAVGLALRYGEEFCEEEGADRTLLIDSNIVLGPGDGSEVADIGIQTTWVCGSSERNVDLIRNYVGSWKHLGMDLVQTADIQVSCNEIQDSQRGVDVWRDSEPTGTSIRMRENRVEALSQNSNFFAVETNDAVKTKLGPNDASLDKGKNRLVVYQSQTKFIYENDATSADTLNARNNYWYLYSSGTETLATVDSLIANRLAPSGYSINFSNYYTSDGGATFGCQAPSPSTFRRIQISEGDEARPVDASGAEVPIEFSLGAPYPNPGPQGMTLAMTVPNDRTGTYILEVYDVRGRMLVESRREIAAAGRYRIEWPGLDGSGRSAASGIYFLRLRGPSGILESRKVTLIR